MQHEIDAMPDSLGLAPVSILGVNATGQDADNALICQGRTLPWLQDNPQQDAWGKWNVAWRDVVVLDGENHVIAVYNLTTYDLGIPANYAYLRDLLVQAASPP
jgi:hypothetical protein